MAGPRRSPTSGFSDWEFIARVASGVSIPVFGSGDCIEPEQLVERTAARRRVRRARRPRRAAQSVDLQAGRRSRRRPHAARSSPTPTARGSCSRTSRCCSRSGCTRTRASGMSRRASRTPRHCRTGARSRPLGDQQAARAELVVHEGARQRIAPARRDQRRLVDRRTTRRDRDVLCSRGGTATTGSPVPSTHSSIS